MHLWLCALPPNVRSAQVPKLAFLLLLMLSHSPLFLSSSLSFSYAQAHTHAYSYTSGCCFYLDDNVNLYWASMARFLQGQGRRGGLCNKRQGTAPCWPQPFHPLQRTHHRTQLRPSATLMVPLGSIYKKRQNMPKTEKEKTKRVRNSTGKHQGQRRRRRW